MLHSFLSLFKSPQATQQHTPQPQALTPTTKVVFEADHAEFISIDLKTMSYAEVAALKMPSLPLAIPAPAELEHTLSNDSSHHQPRCYQATNDNSDIPYSDAIVDDLHFNDKNNRAKKKRVHLKKTTTKH